MEASQKYISIVAPVYNEEGNLPTFYDRVTKVLSSLNLNYELLFVNDGSKDTSLEVLVQLANKDDKVKIINFSRNFGHQIAVTAGLDYASGDAIIIIDADLQDPPEVIKDLISSWNEGNEVIDAMRKTRKDSFFKRLTASLFYKVLNSIVPQKIPVNVGDFRLLARKAVDALKQLREHDRYIRGLTSWIGFKHAVVLYDRDQRLSGKSNYPLKKMITLGMNGIFSFSELPLKISTYLAVFFFVLSFVIAGYAILVKILGADVPGWTSTVLLFTSFSAIQMLILAVLSEYIGRIYEHVKNRPLYIVSETFNLKKEQKEDN